MIYFIVTTCIFSESCLVRKDQYFEGINRLKNAIKDIPNSKIIIVENNGKRSTYLDDFGCEVLYTNNNSLPKVGKGHKELRDVRDCINHYKIDDNDFIVKITGRYKIHENSEFIQKVKEIETNPNIHCIIMYGDFGQPVNYKMPNCLTGLIGMKCFYVKQISLPFRFKAVEISWAKATYLIDDQNIVIVKTLGIDICPGSLTTTYFAV